MWDIISWIGTIAFALSGVSVGLEEEYECLVFILLHSSRHSAVELFIRDLLVGIPLSMLWNQGYLFAVTLLFSTLVFYIPVIWTRLVKQWLVLDALGLAAFSIQGASLALSYSQHKSAIIFAALITGIGGGVIRDVLARRKPIVLREELYAVWSIVAWSIHCFWMRSFNNYHSFAFYRFTDFTSPLPKI